MTMEELLNQLQEQVTAVCAKVDTLAEVGVEVKSLDETVKSLTADVTALRAEAESEDEKKSLDEMKTALTARMDGIERTINEQAANSEPKAKNETKSFDALDAAVRAGEDVELKSLDSDLKQQDVFFDDLLRGNYPLMDRVFRRPTNSDKPRYSYPVAGAVNIKGEAAGASGSRKKVIFTVKTVEYQPTVEREDVEDVGAQMFVDEQVAHAEGTIEKVNAGVVDAIEAAGVAKASITDQYNEVAIIETDVVDVIDNDDLNDVISELPVKYRRGAVFTANANMAATLDDIKDSNGRSMWTDSLKEGTPPTLKGYPFIVDENVTDDRLIFGNPKRGSAVIEREKSVLSNIERSGGDYKPYYAARYAWGNTDCRAWKILDIQTS